MTDKPILFSGPMIRALLDGRKTQTRRLLRPQPRTAPIRQVDGLWTDGVQIGETAVIKIPYAVGDRLWVRESWSGEHVFRNHKPSERQDFAWEGEVHYRNHVHYWADGGPEYGDWEKPRPSIHMPRYASRITLTVTDVRVQRLRDISETDAKAEGCGMRIGPAPFNNYRSGFEDLWDSLNADRAPWADNPWVVAYTFTVREGNIDD